jgi:hypothetical protein
LESVVRGSCQSVAVEIVIKSNMKTGKEAWLRKSAKSAVFWFFAAKKEINQVIQGDGLINYFFSNFIFFVDLSKKLLC